MKEYFLTYVPKRKRELVAIVHVANILYEKGYTENNILAMVKDLFTPNYPNTRLILDFNHDKDDDRVDVYIDKPYDEITLEECI